MASADERTLSNAQKYLQRGSLERAAGLFRKYLSRHPRDYRVRQRLADTLTRAGLRDEAVRELSMIAEAYKRGGLWPKCAAVLKQILRVNPNLMDTHLELAQVYENLGHNADAATHLQVLAEYRERDGTPEDRVDAWTRLVKLDPSRREYVDKLSSWYEKEGDTNAAISLFEGQLEAARKRGDDDGILRITEKLVALEPKDFQRCRALASLYLERSDGRRALGHLQTCFQLNAEDATTLQLLSRAFLMLGEQDKAETVLGELQRVYEKRGMETQAQAVRKQLAQLGSGPQVEEEFDLFPVEEDLEEGPLRAVIESSVYERYGLAERASNRLAGAIEEFPEIMALRKQALEVAVRRRDFEAAGVVLVGGYKRAMETNDYALAKACLELDARLRPDDGGARSRLREFREMFGALLGEGPNSLVSHVSDMDASDLADDGSLVGGDLGGGTGFSIAGGDLGPRGNPDAEATVSDMAVLGDLDDLGDLGDLGAELDAALGGGMGSEEMAPMELGRAYLDVELWDDAIAEFRKAAEDPDPETAFQARILIGQTLRRKSAFGDAVQHYRGMIAAKGMAASELLEVMYELGLSYEEGGDLRRAYQVYTRLVRADRNYANGSVIRKVALLSRKLGGS